MKDIAFSGNLRMTNSRSTPTIPEGEWLHTLRTVERL